MNDLACRKLCEIVARYGPGVCDEPRRLRALLADLCPGMPRQVHTLVAAAEQQVVSELRGSAATVPWSILAGRLARRLVDETGMAEPDARWVVETWGKALGRTDIAEVAAPVPVTPVPQPAVRAPATVADTRPVPVSSGQVTPMAPLWWIGIIFAVLAAGVVPLVGWLNTPTLTPKDTRAHQKTAYDGTGRVGKAPVKVEVKLPPPNSPSLLDCTGEDGVSAAEMRKAQKAWAEYLGRQVEETVEIDKGVMMTFVLVPPGKFRMGSPEGESGHDKDETLHVVTLSEPFYLGKYEVTQAQYEALADTNKTPSHFKGADLPVESVTWTEARDCAVNLTKLRDDKHLYRLPTEAEWEYSCRGGRSSSKPFGIGDGTSLSSLQANFDGKYPYGGADLGRYLEKTSPVGSYTANALGLFDMHGNVWEWCDDRYGPYPAGEATNPSGPPEGSARVRRGGGWSFNARICRAAYRDWSEPGDRYYYLGFRLALSVPSGGK